MLNKITSIGTPDDVHYLFALFIFYYQTANRFGAGLMAVSSK
jgi:hypothetical protein